MAEHVDEAYVHASYLPKLQATNTIVLLDIDGTLTIGGTQTPGEQELTDRAKVRELINRKGVVAGAVTARTCSLTLSSKMYEASESLKTKELPTKWGIDPETKKRMCVPLEDIPFFNGCTDFDFTASFGGPIIVRNGNGYVVDEENYMLLRHDYAKSNPKGGMQSEPWRHMMSDFAYHYLGEFQPYMAPLEQIWNYQGGLTDSSPLSFRYQFNFVGNNGLEMLRKLRSVIDELRMTHPMAMRIEMVDESKPNPSDPEKSRYTLYLVPRNGTKEKYVNRVFSQSVLAAEREVRDTRLFYAGDSPTDLRSGLYAGGHAEMTFLLANGSLLAPYLMGKKAVFGIEDLSFLWEKPPVGRYKHRLVETTEKGIFRFVHSFQKALGRRPNRIVVGDERYRGLTAPGSVHAFLEEFL